MSEITTGTKVTYTSTRRDGTIRSIIHGEVTMVYPDGAYPHPMVIVQMTDGPMAGDEKNFAVKDLTVD